MNKNVILIVGLGNPGKEFVDTRHNIGFSFVDALLKEGGFLSWNNNKKFEAEVSEGKIDSKKIILFKPQTFMNNSGRSVKTVLAFYKIPSKNLWIINDDMDLPIGTLRIQQNRGSAGHKGVESIINHIKTKDFARFRIGIKPKAQPKIPEKFVLEKFKTNEGKVVEDAKQNFILAIRLALQNNLLAAMNKFN